MTEATATPGHGDLDGSAAPPWWLLVVVGVLAIAVGILAVAWPGKTLLLVGWAFGIFLLLSGVAELAGASGAGVSPGLRVLRILLGLLAIVAGILLVIHPAHSVLTAAWVLGLWFVLHGAGELTRGFVYSENRAWNLIFGLIGIAAGIIILVNPKVGIVTLVWIVSIGFILRGIVAIALGLAVRRLQQG